MTWNFGEVEMIGKMDGNCRQIKYMEMAANLGWKYGNDGGPLRNRWTR